ncbi:histidine phosphatase family protein [Rhizobacter sp. Root1221]|uniref:histidine phosphatase family protein n=1 Tax=Rhizobacter sp. Root1221 TaxID=1736433 RepID=UPI0006F8D967|nr:histidine phosphatase family protein [Rhizobacter sp. Root1221]KQV91594.1 phosphoglycerate mutase [Rhizobacter sp. Root1221]
MNPTRILAIRHGETAWNVDTRIQGQLDIPLNATGRWQAGQLSRAVAHEGLSAIYTSDLLRAHETAEAVGRGAGLPLVKDMGLRERAFGVFQGRTFTEIEAAWPEASMRWRKRDPDFVPEGGESLRVFYDRCATTATRLAAAHPGETIAFVAHGGVMDCLYRLATRVDLQAPRSWLLGNASINRLLYTPEGFTLIGWSDTQHLDGVARDESNDAAGPADRVGHAA